MKLFKKLKEIMFMLKKEECFECGIRFKLYKVTYVQNEPVCPICMCKR